MPRLFSILVTNVVFALITHPLIAQWTQTTAPIGRVQRLVVDADTVYAAYSGNSPSLLGAHRSTNDGSTWTSLNNGITGGQLEAMSFAFADSGLLLGTGQGVLLSTNRGQTWRTRNTGLPSFRTVADFGVIGDAEYVALVEDQKSFLSTNAGLSWSGRVDHPYIYSILVHGATMYAAANNGIYKSTNNGTSWSSISAGLPFFLLSYQILSINDTLYICSNGEGVFRSTNDGASWEPRNNGLSSSALSVISLAGNQSLLLAGTFFDGVFVSTDRGANWTSINQGLTSLTVSWLTIKPPYAFAGVNGIWRRLLTDLVTSVESERGDLMNFALQQNYPNPFNPSTVIQFSLPHSEFVSISVFNLLGERVAKLVSDRLVAGTHATEWNATHLPAGVYFCRMQAGEYTDTKKLILLK